MLHRDLKPANIRIDGRGQPRITDFGLAGLAAEIPLSDLRSGTPAYMSPEQKAGRDVTVRSDVYALGRLMHEMFTGRSRQGSSSSNPSALVNDLDPAIDRVILRCLEDDPKDRPASAIHVAMALPGGDPVVAALAAGETPSPEMVAASQEKEGFSPRAAILCAAGVVVALAVGAWLATSIDFTARAPLPRSADQLALLGEQFLRSIGYGEPGEATAYGFACCDLGVREYLDRQPPERRAETLARHQPPVISFFFREHVRPFSLPDGEVRVTNAVPEHVEPGMRMVTLDALGPAATARAAMDRRHRARADGLAAVLHVRRLWPADVLAVFILNLPLFASEVGGSLVLGAMMLGPSLVWIWLMRRFGFLTLLVLFTFAPVLMYLPHYFHGWLGERLVVWHLLPVAVAAWAVWVIASARPRVYA